MRLKIKLLLIIGLLTSCNRSSLYECVCYNSDTPSIYTKYEIEKNHTDAYNNCKALSNDKQYCDLTK